MIYQEKLQDPRWQKKRLQVFERDEFTCRGCCDDEGSLHVHHLYYLPETEPWDYSLDALLTLCKPCHEQEGPARRAAEGRLLASLKKAGWMARDLDYISNALKNIKPNDQTDVLVGATGYFIANDPDWLITRYLARIHKKVKVK